jgi:preprotein translocase subunit SecG
MTSILITLHIILVLAMIGLILFQRSEGGGFGSSAPTSSFFSVRGKTDFLTRTTAILATAFFVNCFVLALIASHPDRPLNAKISSKPLENKAEAPIIPDKK